MKHTTQLVAAACVVAALALGPASMSAATKKKSQTSASSPAAETTASSTRPIPFHGKVSEVDQTAKTFTIAGKGKSRVFKVTDKTVITKGAATGMMSDITQNEQVSGAYWKMADGRMEAKTVKVSATGTMEKKGKKSKKAKDSASPTS